MPSIDFNDEDFEFLKGEAEKEGISLEEFLSNMVDRQRLIAKYASGEKPTVVAPMSNIEPPHRKWGM